MIEATKFYVRHRGGYPETEMQDYARRGFWAINVETEPFESAGAIDGMSDLGPDVGVAGYIGDVWRALRKLGRDIPPPLDYPEPLAPYLGRRVWQSTLGAVRDEAGPVFVKPIVQKAFTGFVWVGDQASRMRVVTIHDETPVLCSDPLDLVAEHRAFVLDGEILDVRRYRGDWGKAPARNVVEAAAAAMKGSAPRAYCTDWGVTAEGSTVLVEANEGYAFGHYGLHPVLYARMLSARWHELVTGARP